VEAEKIAASQIEGPLLKKSPKPHASLLNQFAQKKTTEIRPQLKGKRGKETSSIFKTK